MIKSVDLESCTVKEIVRRLQDDKGLSLTDSQIRYVSELVDSVLIEKITAEEDARLARELQQEELKRTSRVRPSRTGRPQTKQRSPQTKPTKIHRNARSKGASASRVSGFNKPYILSTALSQLLNGERIVTPFDCLL